MDTDNKKIEQENQNSSHSSHKESRITESGISKNPVNISPKDSYTSDPKNNQ